MNTPLLPVLIFLLSLVVLIKASSQFTKSAEKIGIYLGIPSFIVGVTIVSIGTSLPELVSSIVSVLSGASEIVAGNVVGSNITNIFLVLGVVGVVGGKLHIEYELIHVDLPLFVGSSFLLSLMLWDRVFSPVEAVLSLMGFVLYMHYTLNVERELEHPEVAGKKQRKKLETMTIITLVLSTVFIYLGAKYTVESIITLSEEFNIGKEIIAASAVALGTSLPELMVSVTAAREGRPELAIGNVLGSNIFNSFVVMSIPAFFGVLVIPESIVSFALPLMFLATLLYVFITQDKQITKWEGWLLIIFYLYFIGKIIGVV
ncbi:inner membrane protein YrbG [archaeon BMS3Bbin16]|nr:inner membrane protein YrbG [archaeon BMS3Bbin16]